MPLTEQDCDRKLNFLRAHLQGISFASEVSLIATACLPLLEKPQAERSEVLQSFAVLGRVSAHCVADPVLNVISGTYRVLGDHLLDQVATTAHGTNRLFLQQGAGRLLTFASRALAVDAQGRSAAEKSEPLVQSFQRLARLADVASVETSAVAEINILNYMRNMGGVIRAVAEENTRRYGPLVNAASSTVTRLTMARAMRPLIRR